MKLLDYKEAAALLRISPQTLRRKVMIGMVPHYKPYGKRGRTFFSVEDLEKFIINSRCDVGAKN